MIAQDTSKFKLEKSNEKVTARGGLLLWGDFLKKLGIDTKINEVMPETQSNRGYDASDYVISLLFMLYGGGRFISNSREIRDDLALKDALGLNVPSDSAIGDWLKRMGERGGIEALSRLNHQVAQIIISRSKLKKSTLVNDPSLIKSGKREAEMTYEGFKGYRPTMAFLQKLGIIIDYEFRNGSDIGRRLEQVESAFTKASPFVKVDHVLLDSEFYQKDVISYLNNQNAKWAIAADKDRAVQGLISSIGDWQPFFDKHESLTQREIGETVHIMNGEKQAFRLIVLRWKNNKTQEYRYHCVATNIQGKSSRDIILLYNNRAKSENTIKELKGGFGVDRLPCGTMEANAVYFGIAILCHNLFVLQKLLTMPNGFRHKTIESVRWLFVQVAAKIVIGVKQISIVIYTSQKKFDLLCGVMKKNYELGFP